LAEPTLLLWTDNSNFLAVARFGSDVQNGGGDKPAISMFLTNTEFVGTSNDHNR